MSRIGTLELPSCQCPIWSEREKETDMGLPSLHQTINLSESVMLTSSRMAVFHSRSIGNTANDSELTVSTARKMLDQSWKIGISYSVYSRNRYIQQVTFHGHQMNVISGLVSVSHHWSLASSCLFWFCLTLINLVSFSLVSFSYFSSSLVSLCVSPHFFSSYFASGCLSSHFMFVSSLFCLLYHTISS